jgi:hypothetical protein
MGFNELPGINQAKFTVNTKSMSQKPYVLFKGVIDLPDPGIVLTPYFTDVHNAVLADGYKEVIFDMSDLEYINSSGIKSIIKFVIKILTIDVSRRYQVVINYTSKKGWQPSSFKPVMLLAPKIVRMVAIE